MTAFLSRIGRSLHWSAWEKAQAPKSLRELEALFETRWRMYPTRAISQPGRLATDGPVLVRLCPKCGLALGFVRLDRHPVPRRRDSAS